VQVYEPGKFVHVAFGEQPPLFVTHSLTSAQVLGEPAQEYPASTVHAAEQPSPLKMFPSSHCSPAPVMPSPQAVVQTLGEPAHEYPASTVHDAEQPSPLV
jgi:hypothetical protein